MTTEEINELLETKYKTTLDSFKGNKRRASLFLDRYSLRDKNNIPIEMTYDETRERNALAIKSDIIEFNQKMELTEDYRFIFGGRILLGLGNPAILSIYNCESLPAPKDTFLGNDGIMEINNKLAQSLKMSAGVGMRIDSLRPKGTVLKSSTGVASGPISFMSLYDSTTGVIKQGGSRKGALLIAMDVYHPDILEFITIKKSNTTFLSNMNIPVLIDNSFMIAVENDEYITTSWTKKQVKAKNIWNAIINNAHNSGDPGILYIDHIKKDFVSEIIDIHGNTVHYPFECTNACGELPLPAYGVCLLGSINLMEHIRQKPDKLFEINYTKLENTVELAVRYMDSIIDYGKYPLPECEIVQKDTRRLGIGTMGLAHTLISNGVAYNSQEGRDLADKIYLCIKNSAIATSKTIGKLKGAITKDGLRNAALLTCPPTGSISILGDTSSGIEPIIYDVLTVEDGLGTYEIKDQLYDTFHNKPYYVTAHDIAPLDRVLMQATIQKHVDSSISSTVNLPNEATVETVNEIFFKAWKLGCKSITVYRDGSRKDAPFKKETSKIKNKRSFEMPAMSYKIPYHREHRLFINITYDKHRNPIEVFISSKKNEHSAWCVALTVLISKHLRGELTLDSMIEELKGIEDSSGGAFFDFEGKRKGTYISSGPAAIGYILELFRNNTNLQVTNNNKTIGNKCPQCNEYTLFNQEGCETCIDCGYTKCG